jgi:hypothetical protein
MSADEVVLGTHECQLRQRITGQDCVLRRFISRVISQHGVLFMRMSTIDTMQNYKQHQREQSEMLQERVGGWKWSSTCERLFCPFPSLG